MINPQARASILGFDEDVIRCAVGRDASDLIAEGPGSFDVNRLVLYVDAERQEHWLDDFFQPDGGCIFVGKAVCDLRFDIGPDFRCDNRYVCRGSAIPDNLQIGSASFSYQLLEVARPAVGRPLVTLFDLGAKMG